MIAQARLDVAARPGDVWPWLVEPARIPRWWTKVVSVETDDGGPLRSGARFVMTQQWSREERRFTGVVVEARLPELLEYRVRRDGAGDDEEARVVIRLVGSRPTRVEYESEIPWPARLPVLLRPLVAWLVRRSEREHLVPLKRLVEAG